MKMTQEEYRRAVKEAKRIMLFSMIRADRKGQRPGIRISKATALGLMNLVPPAVTILAEWAFPGSEILFVG
jgi:hypothetical protein